MLNRVLYVVIYIIIEPHDASYPVILSCRAKKVLAFIKPKSYVAVPILTQTQEEIVIYSALLPKSNLKTIRTGLSDIGTDYVPCTDVL